MMEIKSKEIEMVPVSELIHHPKNMNEHSDDQINRLVKLIEYQGFRNPLVVQRGTNLVVAGNGRLMAARKIGLAYVPVTYQEFDSEAQLYAYMTSDNAIASWAHLDLSKVNTEMLDLGPDFDIDMLGIKDFVLEPIEKFEALTDEDAVPEVVHPITRRGDIWLLGNHRLMCGDSTMIDDVEKLMNGEKADMVFTDPPYGISIVQNNQVGGGGAFGVGKEAKKKGKFIKANKHKEVIGDDTIDVAVSAIKIIKELDIKTQIIWGGNYYANHLDNSNCWIVWDKQTGDSTFADAELAWTNQETKVRVFQHRWSGMVKASEHGEKRVHPTQKPIALALWCFEHYGEKDKGVLDLFGGSGSTLIACEKTGRHCRMMELDPHYCDVIIKRWMNYTGRSDVKLESTGELYNDLEKSRI